MDEILSHSMDFGCPFMQSLPARGAWIEIPRGSHGTIPGSSLPARGAWIEISRRSASCTGVSVAPRKGSVD